jgi:membrane protease YdiL (CAAX protease family)
LNLAVSPPASKTERGNTVSRLKSPWIFFLIAIGFSWLFWVPAAFIDEDIMNSSWVILLYLGGIGPAVGGILLTYLSHDREYQKEYWQRVFNPKRIGGIWYCVVLLAYPALTLLILLPGAAQGHVLISETLQELLSQPIQLIPFLLFTFLFGPFPEELGWRGYALEKLQSKMSALASSLILGTVWALWHLPLFFMNGTYQNELGFRTAAFWRFCIFAIVISIFFTWVYNNNKSSTLSATLFHFSTNLTGYIFVTSEMQETWRIIVLIVLAVVITIIYGFRDLSPARVREA